MKNYHNFLEDPDFIKIKQALIGIDNDLNEYQKKVLQSIINKDKSKPHNLIIQPTGSGKSLCFQLPILYNAYKSILYDAENPTMGIVITPTISLMEDQVQQIKHKMDLSQLPVKVSCYHHCLLEKEKENVMNELKSRYINILYVTPESLLAIKDEMMSENQTIIDNDEDHKIGNDVEQFEEQRYDDYIAYNEIEKSYNPNISHIVFDECHLITDTSILYRPQYCYELRYLISEISNMSLLNTEPQIIALTASLTTDDTNVLLQKLGIKSNEINQFVSNNWNRPNLNLQIIKQPKTRGSKWNDLIEHFMFDDEKYNTPSIIYSQTRRNVNRLTTKLSVDFKDQKVIEAYHAMCNRRERRQLQTNFYENKTDILVSTNAFGLGVNKNDIQSIIHLGIPPNVERYYQETGRAGRNHNDDTIHNCYCYYDDRSLMTNDFIVQRQLFDCPKFDGNEQELHEHIKHNLLKFYQMLQYLVTYKNYTILTSDIVSEFLKDNFEYIFGYNENNYYKNGNQKMILYDSKNVLVSAHYYIGILKQCEYLKPTQEEYFDIYIPHNLDGILCNDSNNSFDEMEVLKWFVNDYLLNNNDFKLNQWNDVWVTDIQSKWDKYVQKLNENGIKIIKTSEDGNDILTLKRIESLFEMIKIKYYRLHGIDAENIDNNNIKQMIYFDFEKDVKDTGFELEDADNKNFEIKNINQLIEWDQDIKRQREKWEYLKNWLNIDDKDIICNDEISQLFQKYFK